MLSCPRLKELGPRLSRHPMHCEDKQCDRKQMSKVPQRHSGQPTPCLLMAPSLQGTYHPGRPCQVPSAPALQAINLCGRPRIQRELGFHFITVSIVQTAILVVGRKQGNFDKIQARTLCTEHVLCSLSHVTCTAHLKDRVCCPHCTAD